jgi:putative transposase
MSRIGRFVVPDLPHHVTQRGNRREKVFFGDEDYALYRDLLQEACRREGVAVWAYCLMPNPHPLPDSADAGGPRAGARQGASALFGLRQRADAGNRSSLSGPLFLGRDGRRPPDGGGALPNSFGNCSFHQLRGSWAIFFRVKGLRFNCRI